MQQIINEIYDEVKHRCMLPSNAYGIGAWDHHIELVYKIALKNCDEYGANKDIVALASLLHDIASVTNKDYVDNHHIIGSEMAKNILKKYDLSDDILIQVQSCILNHRGSVVKEKRTKEEICVADADAMAHFNSIPSLLRMVYVEKHMSIDEGVEFVSNKLARSYNKLSEKGKEIIKPNYEASKKILIRKEP